MSALETDAESPVAVEIVTLLCSRSRRSNKERTKRSISNQVINPSGCVCVCVNELLCFYSTSDLPCIAPRLGVSII